MPCADSIEAFEAVVRDEDALRPGVLALCRALGLEDSGLHRLPTGSLPLYAVDGLVLKLFPPVYATEEPVETTVLAAVNAHLPVATPTVQTAGEHDGWRYVLMDRLPGVDLSTVWGTLARDRRKHLARQVGGLVAALHKVQAPAVPGREPHCWEPFVAEQTVTAVGRHRRWGLPERWLEQVPAYLTSVELAPERPVLLHTEVMPANLLACDDGEGMWSLTGLCDFESAMHGSHEYDFVAVGVFLAEGDPVVLREVLTGYGYATDRLDADLSRRLLAWTLLHRYGNVSSYLRRLPLPVSPTLDALAESWFGTSADARP